MGKYFAAVLNPYTKVHNYYIMLYEYIWIFGNRDRVDKLPNRHAFSPPLE